MENITEAKRRSKIREEKRKININRRRENQRECNITEENTIQYNRTVENTREENIREIYNRE